MFAGAVCAVCAACAACAVGAEEGRGQGGGRARAQGRPRLLPACGAAGDEHDAFLALSSEVGACTAVLDVRGTTFRPADLPGLERGAATLALAAVPGGWLLQATAAARPR